MCRSRNRWPPEPCIRFGLRAPAGAHPRVQGTAGCLWPLAEVMTPVDVAASRPTDRSLLARNVRYPRSPRGCKNHQREAAVSHAACPGPGAPRRRGRAGRWSHTRCPTGALVGKPGLPQGRTTAEAGKRRRRQGVPVPAGRPEGATHPGEGHAASVPAPPEGPRPAGTAGSPPQCSSRGMPAAPPRASSSSQVPVSQESLVLASRVTGQAKR